MPSLASLFLVSLACEYKNLESLLSMPFSELQCHVLQEMLELGQKWRNYCYKSSSEQGFGRTFLCIFISNSLVCFWAVFLISGSEMHVCVVAVLKHKDCLIQQYPQGSTDFLLPLMLPVRGKKDQAFSHVSNAPQPECKFLVLVEFLNSFSNTFNKLVLIGLGPLSPSSQSWRRTHEQTRQWLEASGVVSTSQNLNMNIFHWCSCNSGCWWPVSEVPGWGTGAVALPVPSASLPGSSHNQGTIKKQFGHYAPCGILPCHPFYHCGVQ